MISQFDVVQNPSAASGAFVRYAVVLSSHHLEGTGSLMLTLAVGELMSVDVRRVGHAIGSLRDNEDDIRRALERVFSGF